MHFTYMIYIYFLFLHLTPILKHICYISSLYFKIKGCHGLLEAHIYIHRQQRLT